MQGMGGRSREDNLLNDTEGLISACSAPQTTFAFIS